MIDPRVRSQYAASDPLTTRLETHRRYSERHLDLDAECAALMRLDGDESVLDVGAGPGVFERFLRARGHRGLLLCVDQSRTMASEASAGLREQGHTGEAVVGDAQHVPVRDGAVDWVVARHMLYHVADIPAALREFRRVLRPGGRLLVSTNAARSYPGIIALWDDMRAAFDLPPAPVVAAPFAIENAEAQLRAVFPRVETHILQNAFVFTEAAPVVRYVATLMPSLPVPPDAAQSALMRDWLEREATTRIRERGGVWRDPKDVGVYICER